MPSISISVNVNSNNVNNTGINNVNISVDTIDACNRKRLGFCKWRPTFAAEEQSVPNAKIDLSILGEYTIAMPGRWWGSSG